MTLPKYETLDGKKFSDFKKKADLETLEKQLDNVREIALNTEAVLCFCRRFEREGELALKNQVINDPDYLKKTWKEIKQTLAKLTSFKGEIQ